MVGRGGGAWLVVVVVVVVVVRKGCDVYLSPCEVTAFFEASGHDTTKASQQNLGFRARGFARIRAGFR